MKSCLTPADGMRGGSAPITGEPMWTSLIERRMEESMAGQRQKKSKTKVAFIDARDLPETSTQLLELDGNVRRKTYSRTRKTQTVKSCDLEEKECSRNTTKKNLRETRFIDPRILTTAGIDETKSSRMDGQKHGSKNGQNDDDPRIQDKAGSTKKTKSSQMDGKKLNLPL